MTLLQEVKEKFSIIGKDWDTAIFEIQGRQVTISKENFIDIAKDTDLESDPFIAYDLKFVFNSDSSVLYRRKFSDKWYFNVPNRYEIEVKKLSNGNETTILELNDSDKEINIIKERQSNEELFYSKNEIDILREQVLDLNNQIEVLTNNNTNLQNEKEELISNIEQLEVDHNSIISNLNSTILNLNERIEELTNQLNDNETIRELRNQVRDLTNLIESKNTEIDNKNQEIENLETANATLQDEINRNENENTVNNLRAKISALNNIQSENELLLAENTALKNDIEVLTTRNDQLSNTNLELEENIKELTRKNKTLEFEKENLQDQVNTFNDNYMKSILSDAYNLMTEVHGLINSTNFDNLLFNTYKHNYKNFTDGFVEHEDIENITFDERNLKILKKKINDFISRYKIEVGT